METTTRWTHPVSPFPLQLCGIALIVVGIMVQIALHNTYRIDDVSASGVPIVIIGVGVVIFFIAFFGCCGAWKENYCMITMVLQRSTASCQKEPPHGVCLRE